MASHLLTVETRSPYSPKITVSPVWFTILFLFFSFFSQFYYPQARGLSLAFFGMSLLILLAVLLTTSRDTMFLFLYITLSMRIIIPFAPQREIQLILPTLFLIISIVRFFPRFLSIKKEYNNTLLLVIGLFFILSIVGIFHNIKIPGINAVPGENSGILNRFNLYNSIAVFITGLILFDYTFIEQWAEYFFRFHLIIIFISIGVIVLDLKPFPLFNTFTWSVITESSESKKMIIAGVAGAFALIYSLVFIRSTPVFITMILLCCFVLLVSGSRISFLAGILMIFMSFVTRRGALGKSLIILALGVLVSFYVLLSPLILLVPEKYQRLVIIFPPEYYTGELAELSTSAAASSTHFRFDIWGRAISKIKEHPWIGNSFSAPRGNYNFQGTSMEGFQKIPTEILYNDFLITGSLHNTFFSIAYLLGIPALLLFAYFIVRLIIVHYRSSRIFSGKKRNIALFITLILINHFIFALVSDIIFNFELFLFLALAVKVYLFYYNKDDIQYSDKLDSPKQILT